MAFRETGLVEAEKDFDRVARIHYVDGRWGVYRAIECDQEVPKEVLDAMDRLFRERELTK